MQRTPKVGDIVTVKTKEKINEDRGGFVDEMYQYCGKSYRVEEVDDDDTVQLEGCQCWWFNYKKHLDEPQRKSVSESWMMTMRSDSLKSAVSKDVISYKGDNWSPDEFKNDVNDRRRTYECWKKNFGGKSK